MLESDKTFVAAAAMRRSRVKEQRLQMLQEKKKSCAFQSENGLRLLFAGGDQC